LRYVNVNDLPAAAEYRDVKIRNRAGDDLGRVDGFIVDSSGRPDWFDTGMLPVSSRSPRRGASASREVPISTEQEDRERVIAREDTPKDEELRRERIRGRTDDDIR
jgi:hypothetical protein